MIIKEEVEIEFFIRFSTRYFTLTSLLISKVPRVEFTDQAGIL